MKFWRRADSGTSTRQPLTFRRFLAYFGLWALIAFPATYMLLMTDSDPAVIAGHDVQVEVTTDSYATAVFGPYLPDVRYPLSHPPGVRLIVGKTNVDSYSALLQRYATIGAHPQGEINKVKSVLMWMIIADSIKGAAIGLAGPVLWLAIGRRRRRELVHQATPRRIAIGAAGLAAIVVVTSVIPWEKSPEPATANATWEPVEKFLPEANITGLASNLEIQGGLMTSGTRRIIASLFDSFAQAKEFYNDLESRAPSLADDLRQPGPNETVAMQISDRHDNVGMDPVARAIAKAGHATILYDTGDDTSTGSKWEAFSLDSLSASFEDMPEKYVATGNHDNGPFVGKYLEDHGFHVLKGEPVTTDDDIRILGVPDPRSSGLGSWRVSVGATMDEVEHRVAQVACKADREGERISTLLVHDADLGDLALQRGCVDLVLAGHLHTQVGPYNVRGDNGKVGVSYTNGTTGGAAYAIALGSKLRREAEVTFITYRDGRPIGLQPVTIDTTGKYTVHPFIKISPTEGVPGPIRSDSSKQRPTKKEHTVTLRKLPVTGYHEGPANTLAVFYTGWQTGSQCNSVVRVHEGKQTVVVSVRLTWTGESVKPMGPLTGCPQLQPKFRQEKQIVELDEPLGTRKVMARGPVLVDNDDMYQGNQLRPVPEVDENGN